MTDKSYFLSSDYDQNFEKSSFPPKLYLSKFVQIVSAGAWPYGLKKACVKLSIICKHWHLDMVAIVTNIVTMVSSIWHMPLSLSPSDYQYKMHVCVSPGTGTVRPRSSFTKLSVMMIRSNLTTIFLVSKPRHKPPRPRVKTRQVSDPLHGTPSSHYRHPRQHITTLTSCYRLQRLSPLSSHSLECHVGMVIRHQYCLIISWLMTSIS